MLKDELRAHRKRNNMTQQQVADMLGVDRTTYTFYETGKANPPLKTLKRLATIFSVPISRLLADEMDGDAFQEIRTVLGDGESMFDPMDLKEYELLMRYRVLSSEKKAQVHDLIVNLSEEAAAGESQKETDADPT